LDVPPTPSLFFIETAQFSAIVLNLLAHHRLLFLDLTDDDYILTGSWSKRALDEAKCLGGVRARVVVDGRRYSKDNVPLHGEYAFSRARSTRTPSSTENLTP
jgi:phosphoserine aminotransferase